jgi:hypothetical protein
LKIGARNRENDVFAGKDYELFWSIGAPESMKSQTPSTKLGPRPEGGDSEGEITNKSQIPISNDQNRFRILVIVICLIFEICDLEFLVTLADCRKGERLLKPP